MQQDVNRLLDEYLSWYQKRYSIKELRNAHEIVTPFVNHLNDRISLFVELLENGKIKISDDGVTLDELIMFGINIKTTARKKILDDILRNFDLSISDGIIFTTAQNANEFSQKKHNILQGILRAYDILFTSRESSTSIFKEEVLNYFFENEFGGTPEPDLVGASGLKHNVDYSIGATKTRPFTLIKLLQDPKFTDVAAQKYISDDLKNGLAKPNIRVNYLIIANDSEKNIPEKSLIAAQDMGIGLIPWSNKKEILSLKQ